MISRAIVKAWLMNATVVVTVICSACTTSEKRINTVNQPNQQLLVQLDIESGTVNGVTQGREFKSSSRIDDGIEGVVNLGPQAISVIDGVTAEGQSFLCCGYWIWWWNCFNVSEVVVASSFNPVQKRYEIDYLGTPDGNGGVRKLERLDFDPTATINNINVLNHNVGMFEQDAGTDTFVIDNDGKIWN